MDPHHFLNQIGPAIDIGPPGRDQNVPDIGLDGLFRDEAQPPEDIALLLPCDIDTAQRQRHFGAIGHRLDHCRITACGGLTGNARLRSLAAAKIEDHLRRRFDHHRKLHRIDPALETRAGIRRNAMPAPGAADPFGIEPGAFEQHIGGRFGDAAVFAAHHPAKAEHEGIIGNHAVISSDGVVLAVEREEAFAQVHLGVEASLKEERPIVDYTAHC